RTETCRAGGRLSTRPPAKPNTPAAPAGTRGHTGWHYSGSFRVAGLRLEYLREFGRQALERRLGVGSAFENGLRELPQLHSTVDRSESCEARLSRVCVALRNRLILLDDLHELLVLLEDRQIDDRLANRDARNGIR